MTYERLACVLSGGGAKAAAHVGAVRALEERGLAPSCFVGTSMGAVVAACFASGLEYAEVLRRITAVSRRDVAVVSPGALLGLFAESLFRAGPLRETLSRLVPARTFDQLVRPLTVTAVEADSGELVLFGASGRGDVPLLDALYASCALPLYYPPAVIDGRRYLDGGVRAVLPLAAAARLDPDLVFAVMVGPSLVAPAPDGRVPALVRVHDAAVRILMAEQAGSAVEAFRAGPVPLVLVEPELEGGATFAVKGAARYVEQGYRAAMGALAGWEAGA